jgi:uncharacterized protein (TIGR02145 family)
MKEKIKIKLIAFMILGLLFLTKCEKENRLEPNPVIDGDGNIYGTVFIGTQEWMAENLKTTKYNDGAPIPLVSDYGEWSSLTTPARCWYNNNDPVTNRDTYGAIYNWHAINTDKLCPVGWHVPTDEEWTIMINYLGNRGDKLKETGTTHWNSPNADATNETGFTALPGGYRSGLSGAFIDIGYRGYWYISYPDGEIILYYNNGWFGRSAHQLDYGFSVRCIKDN